jgi:hypothetical protein
MKLLWIFLIYLIFSKWSSVYCTPGTVLMDIIAVKSIPRPPKWSLHIKSFNQNFICISCIPIHTTHCTHFYTNFLDINFSLFLTFHPHWSKYYSPLFFSDTLNLWISLRGRDQISQPYKTNGRTIVLNTLIQVSCSLVCTLFSAEWDKWMIMKKRSERMAGRSTCSLFGGNISAPTQTEENQ